MSPSKRPRRFLRAARAGWAAVAGAVLGTVAWAQAPGPNFPVTPQQRGTAQQVAQAGVPLSELAPDAPESHTVQRGDTLWDISRLFLRSPWRWPELWGMNLEQIRNPHLIFPGQVLVLVRKDGRATLRLGQAAEGAGSGTVKLSPRVRSELLDNGAIASVPLGLIGPFLDEGVVFDAPELDAAPRIVAAQDGRVMIARGEIAYVRGHTEDGQREFRVFREPRPLRDPVTGETLGFEARYVGTAEAVRPAAQHAGADGVAVPVPATFVMTSSRLEARLGDRLWPVPRRELAAFVPRAPAAPVEGRVVSVYGEAMKAGQNQIVAINRGRAGGMERGHVLALWRSGRTTVDPTDARRSPIRLPDERHGMLFVFRTFERVSYALIVSVKEPVRAGDRFTQP